MERLIDLFFSWDALEPYLPSSVRIRESHELSLPMIYLDPNHRLTQALVELHDALEAGRA